MTASTVWVRAHATLCMVFVRPAAWPSLQHDQGVLVLGCRDVKLELEEAVFLPLQHPHL